MTATRTERSTRLVELTIDGNPVSVPEGRTILEACREQGIDTPTLCYLETLAPVNVCRVCVVELEGSRALVPACSRKVEKGMVVKTDSERVNHSRRLVLEFLASSVDLSYAPAEVQGYLQRYGAELPDSACVYCGNCIAVCPTGALLFKSEYDMRQGGTWDESKQTVTDTICPYCGVGCTLQLHVQDNRIVKATSPLDHDVTEGNLCIKGRFGWQFVQLLDEEPPPDAPAGEKPASTP
jgi:NADH dehydrogenase/NADH:ubiquinone oxidoreductase subunit G